MIPLANHPASFHNANSDKPIGKPDLPKVLTAEVPPQRVQLFGAFRLLSFVEREHDRHLDEHAH